MRYREGDEAVADSSSSSRREGTPARRRSSSGKSWTDGYWPPPPDAVEWREVVNERPTLNPRFVEWLMGWPIGWTDCDSQVTEWFLLKPLKLSGNLTTDDGTIK